ncbi:MAG: hypothetical protein WDM78_13930 [Puia sp.]
MPSTNQLQEELEGKVQIVLVGEDDSLIRPLFEKLRVYKKIESPDFI